MLKIDPAKGMMFNPQESVDFNGNTGPFLQYTCARAYSILRKQAQVVATLPQYKAEGCELNRYERVLILALHEYGRVIQEAASRLSPAIVANYIYELACRFNQFYHECPIAREENIALQKLRLILTQSTVRVLQSGLLLLGIQTPEQM